jgi:cyclophilin family peptidyl-prolyl cis-trans isomerase
MGYYTGTAFHRSIRNFMLQARAEIVNPCSHSSPL